MKAKREKYAHAVVLGLLTLTLAACDDAREEEKVGIDQVPPAVKATIEQESKGGTLKEIEKLTQNGKTAYGAEIVMNGKEQETLISEYGRVIVRRVHRKDEDDD